MKVFPLVFVVAFSLLQSAQAGDLFNPSPGKIDSPRDDAAEVLKRLTTNSDGKTPVVKNLDPEWIKSLADRGEPTLYTKGNSQNFAYIGMPIGGIGAGEIYLSGDGKLWDWDIFGTRCRPGGPVEQGRAYQVPHKVGDHGDSTQTVLDQGFVIRTKQGDKTDTRTLDKDGFSDITFSGQYPVGSVDYSDPGNPVHVHLEAFSPYIPSNLADSSYPATFLNYTIENTSPGSVECTLGGWMENAAGISIRDREPILLENTAFKKAGYTALNFEMKEAPADVPNAPTSIKDSPDVGNMALAVMGDAPEVAAQVTGAKSSDACLDAPAVESAELKAFGGKSKLVGALRRTCILAPGEKKTISFIVAWYFPNALNLGLSTPTNRQYAARFKSAQDVIDHLAANFDQLVAVTHAWHDTWYDSTLPYYFLDRTFLNTSTLATSTSYLLGDGRFYGYEGRYSCPGTCTHVWGYQQAMGYLFPELERALMEKVEFVPGLGMNAQGGVAMRGEYNRSVPVDGQSGIILRTYLAHRMSPDNAFLQRNYGSVKKAVDYLVNNFDKNHEGILEGPQANTMDAAWSGKITWLSLYYQAALRAAAEMADASNDGDYARSLREIADKGRNYVETQLFNGEYFIQQPDPAHPESPGTYNGCPLEQVMGQNWAYQVGLGDIIDPEKTRTALDSIWKYDYTTDVGLYRDNFKKGRWYAMAGEGGLIMCTFPHGGEDSLTKGNAGFSAYDNECWAGSEYEETAVMMWDGLVDKALAEIKTVHARYDGAKRNPWDECECGSHYSRSMASYGVFTAACGFEYNGPKGTMAFAPRVGPENFKAAFTSAEGWGSFSQKYVGKGMNASITLRYGKLRLKTLSLVLPSGSLAHDAKVQIDGKDLAVSPHQTGDRISLDFPSDFLIKEGQSLNIVITP
jgi:non-lysosomal glucosylceramidase